MFKKTMAIVVLVAILYGFFCVGWHCGYNTQKTPAEPKNEPINLIETIPEEPPEAQTMELQPKSIGKFTLTAYCACSRCCGKSDGITATGAKATQGITIAVDPNIIPYGTEVIINGHTYIAQDCGGAIQQKRIDIFFNSHEQALQFGRQTAEVYVKG